MIKPVVPRLFGLFAVEVVFFIEPAGNGSRGADNYLACFARGDGVAVLIDKVNVVLRRSLAH